jgi:hypothetical protein
MLKEINIIASNSNSLKKIYTQTKCMLKYENSSLKIYISELSNSIPTSIQLLTSYFLSTKQIAKTMTKIVNQKMLKLPNVYSEAVTFENLPKK